MFTNLRVWLLIAILGLFPLTGMGKSKTHHHREPLPAPQVVEVVPPNHSPLYDNYRWSLMYYYGVTGDNGLTQILGGSFNRWPEHIQSIEGAYTLKEENAFRRFFSPLLIDVVQVAGNVTVRNGVGQPKIYEFDPFILFRWSHLPWNNYVDTSFAIGEGISYVTSVPAIESHGNDNTKRLLNYLQLEATFAAPSHPRLQLVTMIHHRSGAYGLYHAGNSGSNDIGLGLRYFFD